MSTQKSPASAPLVGSPRNSHRPQHPQQHQHHAMTKKAQHPQQGDVVGHSSPVHPPVKQRKVRSRGMSDPTHYRVASDPSSSASSPLAGGRSRSNSLPVRRTTFTQVVQVASIKNATLRADPKEDLLKCVHQRRLWFTMQIAFEKSADQVHLARSPFLGLVAPSIPEEHQSIFASTN